MIKNNGLIFGPEKWLPYSYFTNDGEFCDFANISTRQK